MPPRVPFPLSLRLYLLSPTSLMGVEMALMMSVVGWLLLFSLSGARLCYSYTYLIRQPLQIKTSISSLSGGTLWYHDHGCGGNDNTSFCFSYPRETSLAYVTADIFSPQSHQDLGLQGRQRSIAVESSEGTFRVIALSRLGMYLLNSSHLGILSIPLLAKDLLSFHLSRSSRASSAWAYF